MNNLPDKLNILKKHTSLDERLNHYTWETLDGRFLKPQDFEDSHLANVIVHLLVYQPHNLDLAALLYAEAKRRELTDEFVLSNHPYQDTRTSRWMIWDFERQCPVPAITQAKLVKDT